MRGLGPPAPATQRVHRASALCDGASRSPAAGARCASGRSARPGTRLRVQGHGPGPGGGSLRKDLPGHSEPWSRPPSGRGLRVPPLLPPRAIRGRPLAAASQGPVLRPGRLHEPLAASRSRAFPAIPARPRPVPSSSVVASPGANFRSRLRRGSRIRVVLRTVLRPEADAAATALLRTRVAYKPRRPPRARLVPGGREGLADRGPRRHGAHALPGWGGGPGRRPPLRPRRFSGANPPRATRGRAQACPLQCPAHSRRLPSVSSSVRGRGLGGSAPPPASERAPPRRPLSTPLPQRPVSPCTPEPPGALPPHNHQRLLGGPRPDGLPQGHGEGGAGAVEAGRERGHEPGHHHGDHEAPEPCGQRGPGFSLPRLRPPRDP